MMALPAAGAFLLAHASDTHPRLAPQVHPAGQAGSFMQAASARQAASAGRAAPAVVGGPADVQVKGAAVANAATGQVLWSVGLNTERPIGGAIGIRTGDTKAPATACCSRRAGTA